MCNMLLCHCIFYVFIKNQFAVINCIRLKSTFGIKTVIGFRGILLWSWVWLGFVVLILIVKRNGEQFKNRD
jgi:hypothetical protein